jgi:peptidoglycan/xylan/chitin deacetylase (PgdA/CDA1 family)
MNRTAILKASLDVLYYSGASHSLRNVLGGRGAILMLHHVLPAPRSAPGFAPNAGLEITPEYLEAVIMRAKERGYDLLSLDQAIERLTGKEKSASPFVVFTIDDGYRDNLQHALPVFERHGCPFTIFVAPAITDGVCELWWRGLEAVIAKANRVETRIEADAYNLEAASESEKLAAFDRLYWRARAMDEYEQRRWIRELTGKHGIDLDQMCRTYAMTWEELRKIAANPLCTIGAHTINHYAVAKLEAKNVLSEAIDSRDRIKRELGREPTHFAYPYGDETSAGPRDFTLIKEAGFKSAVTTRKGLVFDAHRHHLTALPRVALNGSFQKLRYLDVLLSGTAFAMWNGFRPVSVA